MRRRCWAAEAVRLSAGDPLAVIFFSVMSIFVWRDDEENCLHIHRWCEPGAEEEEEEVLSGAHVAEGFLFWPIWSWNLKSLNFKDALFVCLLFFFLLFSPSSEWLLLKHWIRKPYCSDPRAVSASLLMGGNMNPALG